MKPFFIHHIRQQHKTDNSVRRHLPKGFTAHISPVNDVNVPNRDRMVQLAITFCSNKDEFSKHAGRLAVLELIPEVVNKRDVPALLAQAYNYVEGVMLVKETGEVWAEDESHYMYVLKYVV